MTISSHLTEDQRDGLFSPTGSLSHDFRDKEMKTQTSSGRRGEGSL